MRRAIRFLQFAALFATGTATAVAAGPKFERQEIDPGIAIGYGLAIGDVDGDKKPDILLADKSQIAWYRNGDWKRFVMAENLNPRVGTRFLDNVCIAARDLDGDGKVEVAVGGNWNPGETSDPAKSGSVHYLVRPEDPKGHWKPVKLYHEPTVHRMHWFRPEVGAFQLVVLPLHGIGNKGGAGDPVRVLAYEMPEKPAEEEWETALVDASMHATHNFDILTSPRDANEEMLMIAGKEGLVGARIDGEEWRSKFAVSSPPSRGAGEARVWIPGDPEKTLIAAIEPMHGNEVAIYRHPPTPDANPSREVLDDTLNQGHALAIADVLGTGSPAVVAGWRSPDKAGKVGIKLYVQEDDKWVTYLIDDNTMACEDLKVADLDGDGKLDIIAAGRATKNVAIYWNRN